MGRVIDISLALTPPPAMPIEAEGGGGGGKAGGLNSLSLLEVGGSDTGRRGISELRYDGQSSKESPLRLSSPD